MLYHWCVIWNRCTLVFFTQKLTELEIEVLETEKKNSGDFSNLPVNGLNKQWLYWFTYLCYFHTRYFSVTGHLSSIQIYMIIRKKKSLASAHTHNKLSQNETVTKTSNTQGHIGNFLSGSVQRVRVPATDINWMDYAIDTFGVDNTQLIGQLTFFIIRSVNRSYMPPTPGTLRKSDYIN